MPEHFIMTGPLFDGRLRVAIENSIVAIVDEIGEQGVNDIKTVLGSVLQHPTGNYESKIQTERQQDDLSINDSGIIYGPWLEGVGSRNQTTRFKGYFTFRKVGQQLGSKAGGIASSKIRESIGRMN